MLYLHNYIYRTLLTKPKHMEFFCSTKLLLFDESLAFAATSRHLSPSVAAVVVVPKYVSLT